MDEPAEDPKLTFNKSFTADTKALSDAIARLQDTRATDRQTAIDGALSRIAELTRSLQDAAIYLPSYDQKIYAEQLKSTSEQLATARATIAPRTRFAFKARQRNPPSTTSTSTATSTPSTTDTATSTSTAATATAATAAGSGTVDTTTPELQNRTASVAHLQDTIIPSPHPTDTTTILTLTALTNCLVRPPTTSTSTSTNTSTENENENGNGKESGRRFTNLTVQDVKNSILLVGSIDGPAHISRLENCILVLACRQFRLHECRSVSVYLRCGSRPIIEHCRDITFAPAQDIGEKGGVNMWDRVDDFNWLKEGKPSPHWRVLPPEQRRAHDLFRLDGAVELQSVLAEFLPGGNTSS